MSSEIEPLNALSYDELLTWLLEALQGRRTVPRLSPDELPYVGILRLEATLDKLTRRDLARACAELVRRFAQSGQGDVESVPSLLRLAVGLGLDSVAGPLARLAERFPALPGVESTIKQLVLATIVDLNAPQPVAFWRSILDQDRHAFAGIAIAGLLACNAEAAIDMIETLPDDQSIADAVAIVLEQAIDKLTPAQRGEAYPRVRGVVPRCAPVMRASIEEWLAERGELAPRRPRDLNQLKTVLKMKNPFFAPKPASARLHAA